MFADHKINPKPCSVNGLEGTCMFVWQCINTEGHHIGMCVDTFMFGSCCAHNLTSSQISQIPDSSEPAILYTQPAAGSVSALRPSASNNRPLRPRPKPSTTARPPLYLPNHNDIDRISSSNERPVHNQIRPNNVNYNDVNSLYNSIDKSDVNINWSSSQKPSSSSSPYTPPHPTPSQQFQNSLPDRYNVYSKHNLSTSQISTKLPPPPPPSWLVSSSATEAVSIQTAASNLRPNFVSRPTILSTVLPVAQHRQNSSHLSSTPVSTSTTTTAATTTTSNVDR